MKSTDQKAEGKHTSEQKEDTEQFSLVLPDLDAERRLAEKSLKSGESITWNEDGVTGRLHAPCSIKTVYLRRKGILSILWGMVADTINEPTLWAQGKSTMGRSFSISTFSNIIPPVQYGARCTLDGLLANETPGVIEKIVAAHPDSNFAFLAELGKQRNWKAECSICLKDKNIGTTCGCGHTEIVVFRPCGHAICSLPCFRDLMKSHKCQLKPKGFKTSDGQAFIIPTSPNVDLDNVPFNCPVCRGKIDKTFQAETVGVPGEDILTQSAEKIYAKLLNECSELYCS